MGPERKTETTIISEAKRRGFRHYKLSFLNKRGAPDDWFGKDGMSVLVEFKAAKGVMSAQQLLRHQELREDYGMTVYVAWSVGAGLLILDIMDERIKERDKVRSIERMEASGHRARMLPDMSRV